MADWEKLEAELKGALEGEVRFDPYSKILYSTDASMYRIEPVGVVIPRSSEDVQRALKILEGEGLVSSEPRQGYRVQMRRPAHKADGPIAFMLAVREGPDRWEMRRRLSLFTLQREAYRVIGRGSTMLSTTPDTGFFVQVPDESCPGILHSAVVQGSTASTYTADLHEDAPLLESGQVIFVYYESSGKFTRQPARIDAIEETPSGLTFSFQFTGDARSGAARV